MAGKKLQGQVAIVSGGGRGIGAAAARLLARSGASVVLTARSEEEIDAVANELRSDGLRAIAVTADVSDFEQTEEVVEAAVEQFGRVDILVNNAAVIYPVEPLADVDPDEWAYNVHVNLVGPFYLTRGVLPLMMDQGYGRIVNVTSGAAVRPIVGASAYSAAKAGLDALTCALAQELAQTGHSRITINGYDPGMVDTEMQSDIRSVDAEEMGLDTSTFHKAHTEGRLRSVEEAALGIYWLIGPWSIGRSGGIWRMDEPDWHARVVRDAG